MYLKAPVFGLATIISMQGVQIIGLSLDPMNVKLGRLGRIILHVQKTF